MQSASRRHSASSSARRATHRPASHTARKREAGSGTTIAQAISSHLRAAHRTWAHCCCAAWSFAALIAYGARGQHAPQHPSKVVMAHS